MPVSKLLSAYDMAEAIHKRLERTVHDKRISIKMFTSDNGSTSITAELIDGPRRLSILGVTTSQEVAYPQDLASALAHFVEMEYERLVAQGAIDPGKAGRPTLDEMPPWMITRHRSEYDN